MKVLHVSNCYKPAWESGGVARYAANLAEQFVTEGHNVTVFTTDAYIDDPPGHRPVDIDGVETYYFPNLSTTAIRSLNLASPRGAASTLIKRAGEFDMVHIHEHRSPLAAMAAYGALLTETPYVVQPHGSLPTETGNMLLKRMWDTAVGNSILKRADGYIALQGAEVEQFQRKGIAKRDIFTIRNGFSINNSPNAIQVKTFKENYGLDSDRATLLYVGRIAQRKGVQTLVEALSPVDDVQCVIIGPDFGVADEIETLISDNELDHIHYLGFISEEMKHAAYTYADAFVLPTQAGEGLPTTALEALFFRTPVVATQAANVEFIEQNDCGIITSESAVEIRNACRKLLEKDLHAMGERGRNVVQNQYNWHGIAQELEQAYSEIIEKH